MPAETVILPRRGWAPLDVRELWAYRELLLILVWRNVKVRYKQTTLGIAWAVIQPLFVMGVFTLVFGRLAGLSSEGSPYPVFSFAALVPWVYVSNAVTQASVSLVESERLITRTYFPRLLIPLAVVLAGLLDLAMAFIVLVAFMSLYGVYPHVEILAVLPLTVLAAAAAFAFATWLSALNVFYRDVRYAIAFMVQFWLFLTPVAYATSLVPEGLRPVYALNPIVGVVDGFRWALLGGTSTVHVTLPISIGTVVVLLFGGLYYFRRVEDSFADAV